MKRFELSLLLALIFCAAVSLLAVNDEYDAVRENVLRLHVLANSDSQADQELKLRVRDAIQEHTDEVFSDCADIDEALAAAEKALPELEEAARQVIRDEGYDYSVTVALADSRFPTRTYGGVTLPAGHYNALRVVIGSGQGHNWWCVMFPALCLSDSRGEEELEAVLTDEQMELVTADSYDVRFRCVELYERLLGWLGL